MLSKKLFEPRGCDVCGKTYGPSGYTEVKSELFPDNRLTICKSCLSKEAEKQKGSWDFVDSVCRWADISFIPEKWTKFYTENPSGALGRYMDTFGGVRNYNSLSWKDQNQKWEELVAANELKKLHPEFNRERIEMLAKKFGNIYGEEELERLEEVFQGLKLAYGVNDVLREDFAIKMSKISLEIDRAIASGAPIDKLVSSYNNLQKSGGFTPENARDLNNFESCSELFLYLSKTGWTKKFHNDEPKDVVDMTINAIQAHNARLYKNESTIGEQIEDKIEAKRRIEDMETKTMTMTDSEVESWLDESAAIASTVLDDDIEEEFEV